jgi:hypothetical protein
MDGLFNGENNLLHVVIAAIKTAAAAAELTFYGWHKPCKHSLRVRQLPPHHCHLRSSSSSSIG